VFLEPTLPVLFFFPLGNKHAKIVAILALCLTHFSLAFLFRTVLFGFVAPVISLQFLPYSVWDLFLYHAPSASAIIYYNPRSQFTVTVLAFLTSFLTPHVKCFPFPSNERDVTLPPPTNDDGRDETLRQNVHDWMLSFRNRSFFGTDALLQTFSLNPFTFGLFWLASHVKPIKWLIFWCYSWLSRSIVLEGLLCHAFEVNGERRSRRRKKTKRNREYDDKRWND
jgi:hypothetical protein